MTGDLFIWVGMTVLAVDLRGARAAQAATTSSSSGAAGCGWAADLPKRQVQLIGVLETLAAIALVWPLATRTLHLAEPASPASASRS